MTVDDTAPTGPAHLIHIGYAKAGSTFLQHWFDGHPEIAYVHGGLAGYSSVWDVARRACAPGPAARCRVTSAEQLAAPSSFSGSAEQHERGFTPPGADAEERVADDLARVFPTAHVLLVTRGFLGTLASSHSQHVREAATVDFHAAREAAPTEVMARALDYHGLVQIYRQRFGDRLLVLPFELLRDDPQAFLSRLERRLDLTTIGAIPERQNESLSGIELRWYPRLSRLVLGLPLPHRFRRRAADAWVARTRRNALAPHIRLLQRLLPAAAVDPYAIDESWVAESFAGKAECLRDDPVYAPYQREYLLHLPPP